MEKRKLLAIVLASGVAVVGGFSAGAQEKKGNEKMPTQGIAKGAFDVKMMPIETAHKDETAIARYSLDKVYHGDLEGTGTGEMLASMGAVKTSGTYVAMEVVTGTLAGKKGSFALGHIGTMSGREAKLVDQRSAGLGNGRVGWDFRSTENHYCARRETLVRV